MGLIITPYWYVNRNAVDATDHGRGNVSCLDGLLPKLKFLS